MQYSDDLRCKLVEAWDAGQGTQSELADPFGVSLGWVEKVLRHWRETGDTAASVFRHGPLSRFQPARVEKLVQPYPDATLAELGRRLKASEPTVGRWLRQLGLPRKKVTACSERDTPRVQRLRARGRQTRRRLDPRQLIFVDESGLNLALTRLYARAPRGVRAVGSVPQNYGQSLTVLAALDYHGMRAALLVPGATDQEVFLSFVQQGLGPQLQLGAVVVLDNLAAHKGASVAEAIQKAGAQLCYLPPYSPDYNPIEQAWSKIKTLLRGVGARTRRKLYRSLNPTLTQVTAQDAEAWFAHCGYPLH